MPGEMLSCGDVQGAENVAPPVVPCHLLSRCVFGSHPSPPPPNPPVHRSVTSRGRLCLFPASPPPPYLQGSLSLRCHPSLGKRLAAARCPLVERLAPGSCRSLSEHHAPAVLVTPSSIRSADLSYPLSVGLNPYRITRCSRGRSGKYPGGGARPCEVGTWYPLSPAL